MKMPPFQTGQQLILTGLCIIVLRSFGAESPSYDAAFISACILIAAGTITSAIQKNDPQP